MTMKKTIDETNTFELEVPKEYPDVTALVKTKDYVRMLSLMPKKERDAFFDYYMGCVEFSIVDQGRIGNRNYIAVEFCYDDLSNEGLSDG